MSTTITVDHIEKLSPNALDDYDAPGLQAIFSYINMLKQRLGILAEELDDSAYDEAIESLVYNNFSSRDEFRSLVWQASALRVLNDVLTRDMEAIGDKLDNADAVELENDEEIPF